MDIKTSLKKRDAAITALRDLFLRARICGLSHDKLNDEVLKIKKSYLAKCPKWVIEYFRGYHAALIDSLYRECLVFGGFVDGRFYSTHRTRSDYYEKHGIEPCKFARRGHYWNPELFNGVAKPFFLSE